MTDREKLIKGAAEAMQRAHAENGFVTLFTDWARVALDVFEKAQTLTDDERRVPGFAGRERRAGEAWAEYHAGGKLMSHEFRAGYHRGVVDGVSRSEVPGPTHLVASLSPATDPHEADDARNCKEDHRGDREPKVAVRSTGEHQDSAEGDRDDRDCETDPPEHRLQAAYPHRSTLAETRSGVEGVDMVAEPQGEPSDALTIPRPHVPYGPVGIPEHEADADYLEHAATSLESHYEVGGSNVRATVVGILRDVAAALRAAGGVR